MAKRRFLTKSNFKVGHECPTKLYYLNEPEYPSTKDDDLFLKSLADGGFQVGALAKLYFPGGTEVFSKKHEEALAETLELLKKDRVIIYEAALQYKDYFIRVDVLEKIGNAIRLHEVKAKSWKKSEDSFFNAKGTAILSEWEPYVADIAFQTYVTRSAFPQYSVSSFLMLADCESVATVDGLNQRFKLVRNGRQTEIEQAPGTESADLGARILISVPADDAVSMILGKEYQGKTFGAYVEFLAAVWKERRFATPEIGGQCGGCEYWVPTEDLLDKKSGFKKCWSAATGLPEATFDQPLIFDIWKIHHKKRDTLIESGVYLLSQVQEDDLRSAKPSKRDETGLTNLERQMKQIEIHNDPKLSPYFDALHFVEEMEAWIYPYHFIDFETITAAIPFSKSLRPYETVAFQFSHHTVDEKGHVEHKTQYLHCEPGVFPNYEFVRHLKRALETDQGTVFRYAAHENTVLRHIKTQLRNSEERDKTELIDFIDTLITVKDSKKLIHTGNRCMVDMLELVRRFYLSVHMGGSNSIKVVLPSTLKESEFLQKKYSQSVYGSPDGIKSFNFKNHTWLEKTATGIRDPYDLLGPIMPDYSKEALRKMELLFDGDEIREGGGASTAYARMQFTHMHPEEREWIQKALFRYCELDTLAMVMIYEYWFDLATREGFTKRVA